MRPLLNPSHVPVGQRGLSLIELMVALILGVFLILGAVTVYNQSRQTYRASESVARLQEVARLAMDVLESDIRMASYWGLNNRSDYISERDDFTSAQFTALSLCGATGSNWAIDIDRYLAGSTNSYGLTCAAALPAQTSSDVLVVRRASEATPTQLDTNRVYLQTSRIRGSLFVPACTDPLDTTCIPANYAPPASQSRQLVVHAYYVSSQSTASTQIPSLRRKVLGNVNAGTAAVEDQEVVAGVEDLQIQFGVDTDATPGIDAYVNPNAVPAGARIMAARVWLRIRSEERDFGHVDDTDYQYADLANAFGTGNNQPDDNYRRIVVSKTIFLRNASI